MLASANTDYVQFSATTTHSKGSGYGSRQAKANEFHNYMSLSSLYLGRRRSMLLQEQSTSPCPLVDLHTST